MSLSNHIKYVLLTYFLLLSTFCVFSQEDPYANQYNPHSVRPIRKADQMFKKTLWYRMDLRTRRNEPFYARNNEITKLMIDAVRAGKIEPFQNDSLENRLSIEEFNERLRIPQAELELAMESDNWDKENMEEDWDEESIAKKEQKELPEEYFPRQLYILELKQDWIFDSRRSRQYDDLTTVTMILPGEITPTGLDKVIASFSYRELVEKVFRYNPNAIWFNPQNSAQHRNLADAFDLGLYGKYLVKYENPRDATIIDIYGNNKNSLIKSEEAVYKLFEYEAVLWSY